MPQEGINPPAQSYASYEASALPPSHKGWIYTSDVNSKILITWKVTCQVRDSNQTWASILSDNNFSKYAHLI